MAPLLQYLSDGDVVMYDIMTTTYTTYTYDGFIFYDEYDTTSEKIRRIYVLTTL